VNDSPLISLVLPCRNQADHIAGILARYVSVLAEFGEPFELVVVPNASVDATAEIVHEIARADSRIRVVSSELGGWGFAVRLGLSQAQGDVLGYTNTARTDPAILPHFLTRHLYGGRGLVKARRVARHAPVRELGSAIYNLEARALFGMGCRDINGTPKIFSASFCRTVTLTANGDLLDLELMVRAHRRGVPIEEVELPGFRRHGGRSSTTLKSAWNMYAGAIRLRLTGAA
jgi:Glycosyl transferase family 2